MSERKGWRRQGPDLHSGAAFFPSGLQLSGSQRGKKNNGAEWTSAINAFPPPHPSIHPISHFTPAHWTTRKVPHVGVPRQSFFKGSDRERKMPWAMGDGGKEHREREEEMEREERERRLGSSSTSVQRRLLIMGLRLMAGRQLFSWNRWNVV